MGERDAGQGKQPVPQWVPGWYRRRECDPVAGLVEAVRYMGVNDGDFPIGFLRPNEFVRPTRPGERRGVVLSNRDDSNFGLYVPLDWWIVRGSRGALYLASPAEFSASWVREEAREWRPPRERDVPSGQPAAAERTRHGAVGGGSPRPSSGSLPKELATAGEVRAFEYPAMSDRAHQVLEEVMGGGAQCLDLERLERRLIEADVPFTGGKAPTHEPIDEGRYFAVRKGEASAGSVTTEKLSADEAPEHPGSWEAAENLRYRLMRYRGAAKRLEECRPGAELLHAARELLLAADALDDADEEAVAVLSDLDLVEEEDEWCPPRPFDEPSGMARVERDLAAGAGWKGTEPAEGTRRALILDTIERELSCAHVPTGIAPVLADAVESALLEATIETEARDNPHTAAALQRQVIEIGNALDQSCIARKEGGEGGRLLSPLERVKELGQRYGRTLESRGTMGRRLRRLIVAAQRALPYLQRAEDGEDCERLEEALRAANGTPAPGDQPPNFHPVPPPEPGEALEARLSVSPLLRVEGHWIENDDSLRLDGDSGKKLIEAPWIDFRVRQIAPPVRPYDPDGPFAEIDPDVEGDEEGNEAEECDPPELDLTGLLGSTVEAIGKRLEKAKVLGTGELVALAELVVRIARLQEGR